LIFSHAPIITYENLVDKKMKKKPIVKLNLPKIAKFGLVIELDTTITGTMTSRL
jgi:hypothetical protein